MLFQRKIDRAQQWLHEKSGKSDVKHQTGGDLPSMEELRAEANEEMDLEKGDFFAMLIAALITILPVCLLALLFMCGFMFFI